MANGIDILHLALCPPRRIVEEAEFPLPEPKAYMAGLHMHLGAVPTSHSTALKSPSRLWRSNLLHGTRSFGTHMKVQGYPQVRSTANFPLLLWSQKFHLATFCWFSLTVTCVDCAPHPLSSVHQAMYVEHPLVLPPDISHLFASCLICRVLISVVMFSIGDCSSYTMITNSSLRDKNTLKTIADI